MPLGDVSYQNAALDALVGSWPASGATYRLYSSDPTLEAVPADVELTSTGGYAGVTFAPGDWDAAADGAKVTSDPVSFGAATDAYSDTATFWGVVDAGGLLVFSDALSTPVVVDGAGTAGAFTPSLSFADGS